MKRLISYYQCHHQRSPMTSTCGNYSMIMEKISDGKEDEQILDECNHCLVESRQCLKQWEGVFFDLKVDVKLE